MYKKCWKRIIDIVLSLTALIILLPLFIPVIIILLLTGEHEVFYLQNRIGYKNNKFKIWKFSTMLKNSEKMGTGSLTTRDDPRVLPFGKFLRKTKINELPQFINVLIGDMSIVGARPQMQVDYDTYTPEIQAIIYNTPPGITGIGSIIFRDEEKWISEAAGDKHLFYKENISPYKGAVEAWYQENISFKTDALLFLTTIWVILSPNSDIVYKVFKNLPQRPEFLRTTNNEEL